METKSNEAEEYLLRYVQVNTGKEHAPITRDTKLVSGAGFDSLDTFEMLLHAEEHLGTFEPTLVNMDSQSTIADIAGEINRLLLERKNTNDQK